MRHSTTPKMEGRKMKKRLLSLLLCLVLTCSFATGCNKDDKEDDKKTEVSSDDVTKAPEDGEKEPAGTEAPKATEAPEATETPVASVDVMSEKLDGYTATLEDVLKSMDETVEVVTENFGGEGALKLTIGSEIAAVYGFEGLESAELKFDVNGSELLGCTGTLALNGNDVITGDIIAATEGIYMNLPAYSDKYMLVTYEEVLGMSLEEYMSQLGASAAATAESTELMKNMMEVMVNFATDTIGCFESAGSEENVTVGTGDYTFTGTKYTAKADYADVKDAISNFAEAMEQLSAESMDVTELDDVGATEVYVNYYEGANGEFAWELDSNSPNETPVVIISTADGFCFYVEELTGPEVLLYSVKESDNSGKIVFTNSGEEGMEPLEILYSNFSENSCTIAVDADGVMLEIGFETDGENTAISFSMSQAGMLELVCTVECSETGFKAVADLDVQGMKFGSVSFEAAKHEYAEVTVPTDAVDSATWSASLNQEALMTDLQQFMTDYPFIANAIIGGESGIGGGTGSGTGTYTGEVVPNGFEDMTGYAVDEDGYVYFEPLKEEVLARGEASTNFSTIALTDKQKTALDEYAKSLFDTVEEYEYYSISGSVEYGVDSSYINYYTYYNDGDYENEIEIDYDAISGEFKAVSITTESKENALEIMGKILEILEIELEFTEEVFEDMVYTNEFLLSGFIGESGTVYLDFDIIG